MGLEMFAGPAGPAGRLHRPAPPRNRPARPSVPELPPRDGPATAPGCPVCAAALHGRGDRRYRSAACRQAAHRRRRIALPAPVRLPGRSRGEHTVYECAECGQRLVGEQWCPTPTPVSAHRTLGEPCPPAANPIAVTNIRSRPCTNLRPGSRGGIPPRQRTRPRSRRNAHIQCPALRPPCRHDGASGQSDSHLDPGQAAHHPAVPPGCSSRSPLSGSARG